MISVIIPAYNAERFLGETLESVSREREVSLEIIVVDDGSTDGTLKIANEWTKRDERILVISQENGGVCKARNNGISHASGQFILPVDADDLLCPGFLREAENILKSRPEVKCVIPKIEFFGEREGVWKRPNFSKKLLARKNMIPVTALYRVEDWLQVGGYCETMQAREDWDFWMGVLKNGGEVVQSDILGLRYRIHSQSKRTADRQLKRQVVDSINARHPEFLQRELNGPLHYHRTWSKLLNTLRNLFFHRHLTLMEGYEDCEDFFRAMPAIFNTNRGKIIYNRRNQLREMTFNNHDFVVKSFHVPHLLNRLVYGFLRPSKARRSYEYALKLQSVGLGTPQPVAYYNERFLGLLFGKSYFVSLRSKLPYTYNDIMEGKFSHDEEKRCLQAIANYTARLHDAGMIHRDYSRGNILFNLDGDVEIIDLNRIRFHEISLEEGLANFAERLPASDEQRRIMVETYTEKRGLNKKKS